MSPHPFGLLAVVLKAMLVHTVTYTAVGAAAMSLFGYRGAIREDPVRKATLRDADDPLVMAGPLFQPLRGALFGVVFYLLQSVFFAPHGWWELWVTLVVVGILSTFAPAASSIEGLIYLRPTPTGFLWGGLVEIGTQSLLLSVLTYAWVRSPGAVWLNWTFGVLFVVALALPALGLLARPSARSG